LTFSTSSGDFSVSVDCCSSSLYDTSDAFEEVSEEFRNFCCEEYETSSNISVNEDTEVGEVL
jgi:hypothetical protein